MHARMHRGLVTHCPHHRCRFSGDYSCLQAAFTLRRSLGFHLVQSYIPTILIVMISWVSFWMDVDSVPGRVTLGITTLLTMTTKSSGIQAEVPQVSYVKVRAGDSGSRHQATGVPMGLTKCGSFEQKKNNLLKMLFSS